MFITKTSQYALRILKYMLTNEDSVVTAKILHTRLRIPYQYLRRILTKLSKRGLIIGMKGKGGGFKINLKKNTIFLSDILLGSEELNIFNSCIFGFERCLFDKKCKIHDKWAKAREEVLNILKTTDLFELQE